MKCNYCEDEFIPKNKVHKYCTTQCRTTAEKQRHKQRKGLDVKARGPNDGRTRDRREYSLKHKYGITPGQYEELLATQNNCCAICNKHESEENRRLAVDHNHKTGEIRGLLCTYCNHRIVGKWTDGNLLRKIADYVEQGTGWFVPDDMKSGRRRKRKKSRNGKLL